MLRFRQKVLDIVEQAAPNLPVLGLFASVGYPLFYIIWKVILPQPYENLRLRLILAVISLPWLFYPSLPKKLKGFFPAYLVCSVPLLLPFFFSFMLLKIEWSSVWAMTSLGGLVILILIIYDWLIICVISAFGFALAYGAVLFLDGHVSYTHFQWDYIPNFCFTLVGGMVASHRKQGAHQSRISLQKQLLGEEKRQNLVIEHWAMHDSLTGLPNRRLLSERISLTLAQCRRNKAMAALLIFDLDKFKIVNDSLGHAVGDILLQEVAARSVATLKRSTDSISRLGGDEFVILLPQIVALSDAVTIAEKIRINIKEPYNIDGHTINISCSIGIAVYPDHGETELTLMKHADEAMYRAKNQGRDKVTVFETMSISLLPLLS